MEIDFIFTVILGRKRKELNSCIFILFYSDGELMATVHEVTKPTQLPPNATPIEVQVTQVEPPGEVHHHPATGTEHNKLHESEASSHEHKADVSRSESASHHDASSRHDDGDMTHGEEGAKNVHTESHHYSESKYYFSEFLFVIVIYLEAI